MTASRRDFLKSSGALVVSFSAVAALEPLAFAQRGGRGGTAQVDPQRLDSWIAISADGRVTVFTGKVELGQGMLTAQTQLVAEELMLPVDRITVIQGDTATSPDQGTTSGSQSTFFRSTARLMRAAIRSFQCVFSLTVNPGMISSTT